MIWWSSTYESTKRKLIIKKINCQLNEVSFYNVSSHVMTHNYSALQNAFHPLSHLFYFWTNLFTLTKANFLSKIWWCQTNSVKMRTDPITKPCFTAHLPRSRPPLFILIIAIHNLQKTILMGSTLGLKLEYNHKSVT